MTDELPPSQQRRWEKTADIPHPLPVGTVFSYDDWNRNAIPTKSGQRIEITGFDVETEDNGTYSDDTSNIVYTYTLHPGNPSGKPLTDKKIDRRDVDEWIMRGKYPWYISELPSE